MKRRARFLLDTQTADWLPLMRRPTGRFKVKAGQVRRYFGPGMRRKIRMHSLHVYYRNTQGALIQILNAISDHGLETPYVQAEPVGDVHRVSVLLELSLEQVRELSRDWRTVNEVIDVRAGEPTDDMMEFAENWDAVNRALTSAICETVNIAIA
jgi:hypothetical protein